MAKGERFPEVLLGEMCEVTKKHTPNLEEVIITPEDSEEEASYKELTETYDIQELLGEAGCPICEKDGNYFLGECETPPTGAGCRINYPYCESKGARAIGGFHTHPLGGTTPSLPDLECSVSQKEEVFCIGGRIGDKRKVTCYTPEQRVKEKGLFYNPFVGYYPKFDVPAEGKIVFWRETPPPLASELNVELSDEDLAEYFRTTFDETPEKEVQKSVKEARAGLERGEIFDEYWEAYEPQGEMDEIDAHLPEDLKKLEEMKLSYLSKDYDHRTAECKK